jgi:glycosyltransferase involved in cell wall biosynthesis
VVLSVVSIVIPCHDQGRFLADAIDSARRQTFPGIEVIVVNDGSTDTTAAVAKRYPSVRYVEQPQRGAAAARDTGLAASCGAFVIFLDADDRLLPHAAATGVEYLSAHPDWGFVTGHVRFVTADGSPAGEPRQEHESGGYLALLRANYIWTPGAVMYRRSVFDTVGTFDTAAGGSADYDLNLRIARRYTFGCHHQVIIEYRRHGANMSADPARMLRSALSVRRAQWRHVCSDAAARAAWRAGIALAQADFGGRLVAQVVTDIRVRGRRMKAVRGLLDLLRYYPAGVGQIITAGWRWLRRRRS